MEQAAHKKQNLNIWSQVETTDPEFTKDYKGKGGFQGSAINALYLTKRATETWGPVGIGWGYEILEERFDQGAPISHLVDKDGAKTDTIVYTVIHTLKVKLWYMQGDQRAEVVHYGHTDYIYTNKFGVQTDSEAPKKSLTDALKKCLSMVGFSADVFMGKFDNADYVEEQKNRAALEKADNKADEIERQAAEYRQWIQNHQDLVTTATSLHELEMIFKMVVRKLKARNDETQVKAFTRLKDARKDVLEADQPKGKQANG